MARILGYIGASLDGYIASPDGSMAWLRKYDGVDDGKHAYSRFIAGIGTIVMGRGTFDEIVRFNPQWPYSGQDVILVTSRPVEDLPDRVTVWSSGIESLIAHLRALRGKDVWMMGGGLLQQSFIERNALDELRLFIVPELVGEGILLFPLNRFACSVRLIEAATLSQGCVCLYYDFKPQAS